MTINGGIGIYGVFVYGSNASIRIFTNIDESIKDTDERYILKLYTSLSFVRAILWYGEFFTTFVLLHLEYYKLCLTMLRYILHTLNFCISVSVLVVAFSRKFPAEHIVPQTFPPVLTQTVFLLWVIASYTFIYHSKLYSKLSSRFC